jgi:hypothetical protein
MHGTIKVISHMAKQFNEEIVRLEPHLTMPPMYAVAVLEVGLVCRCRRM